MPQLLLVLLVTHTYYTLVLVLCVSSLLCSDHNYGNVMCPSFQKYVYIIMISAVVFLFFVLFTTNGPLKLWSWILACYLIILADTTIVCFISSVFYTSVMEVQN